MKIVKALVAAFSTFSRIPLPVVNLDSDDCRNSLCFFPAVGLVIALLEAAAFIVVTRVGGGSLIRACVMWAVPVLVTGGIHLDGLCDTCDAKSSYQPVERKLQILKDPHIGAFGMIRLLVWAVLFLGALSELENVYAFGTVFVASRAVTAISVVLLKNAKDTGMGASEKKASNRKLVTAVSVIWFVLCVVWLWQMSSPAHRIGVTAACVASEAVLYIYYRHMVNREFGGFTGDTSGWFTCMQELVMTFIMILA